MGVVDVDVDVDTLLVDVPPLDASIARSMDTVEDTSKGECSMSTTT